MKSIILIVEDEPELLAGYVSWLDDDHTIVTANTGEAAWSMIQAGLQPDLVITDLHMPDMTGHRLIAKIKQDPRLTKTRVLIVSADELTKDLAELAQVAYLQKPVDKDSFRGAAVGLMGP